MNAAIVRTVTSSDLSRNGAKVFRAAEEGPVEITRRDGESLLLTRKSEQDVQFTALNLAADLVAASLSPDSRPFADRLADRFPWMELLTPEGRERFASEIVISARAGAAVHDLTPFLAELTSWHETAATKAAGFVPDAELDWYEDDEPVSRPGV